MDDNSNKVRQCGQIGEGEEDELSMEDVLEEQARLQANASAVLGASDPNNCTYPKGYLKRQALYACATCTPDGNAGICLACTYACHEGHDLYELYTKRYFCCDCGNDKFSGKECKLVKEKKFNSGNRYNQNFKGLYCSCARPYPDQDDTVEDEMIQCVICEDWYHGRHLKTHVPDSFFEMTCPDCMSRFPFLWAYQTLNTDIAVKTDETSDEKCPVDVDSSDDFSSIKIVNGKTSCPKYDSSLPPSTEVMTSVQIDEKASSSDKENIAVDISCVGNDHPELFEGTSQIATDVTIGVKRERDTSEEEETNKTKSSKRDQSESESAVCTEQNGIPEEKCTLQCLQKREYDVPEHGVFWPQDWRTKLCRCQECMEMYQDKSIEFLLEESDTVQAYEDAGSKNSDQVSEDEEENIFAGMHRVQQIEIARGVRDMKTELNEFLQEFAREGKVVKASDVKEFFRSLEEKRRRRMNLPQNNCR